MGPEVRMGVNDRSVGNIEDLSHRDGQKGEGTEFWMFPEVVIGVSAHQDRSTFEAGQSLESRCSVAFGVTPFFLPVKMIVGDHSLPKGGDIVIRQTDVSAGDGSAGKSTDKKVVRISPEFLADAGQVHFAIIDGGLAVTPPSHGVLFFSFLNIYFDELGFEKRFV